MTGTLMIAGPIVALLLSPLWLRAVYAVADRFWNGRALRAIEGNR